MNTYSIPNTDMTVTRIAYGCMPLGGGWDNSPITPEIRAKAAVSIRAALDSGINFFDHADIYCRGKSEEVFSDVWAASPNLRQKIYLQSKCGIRFDGDPAPDSPQRFDFSYEHIVQSVDGILKRLKTDYIDVLLLHRPDPLVEPEEVAKAFDQVQASGKVRYFGVSNHTAASIELLRKYVKQPIIFNQVQFSALHTHLLDENITFNQDRPAQQNPNHGTIEYCRQHDIVLQAWGPVAAGKLTGGSKEPLTLAQAKASAVLAELARAKGVSAEAILVAWILRHPAHIQPVIGTTNAGRIASSCAGDGVTLSREEWYRLFVAGRGERLP